jgi:hypothetical protein
MKPKANLLVPITSVGFTVIDVAAKAMPVREIDPAEILTNTATQSTRSIFLYVLELKFTLPLTL